METGKCQDAFNNSHRERKEGKKQKRKRATNQKHAASRASDNKKSFRLTPTLLKQSHIIVQLAAAKTSKKKRNKTPPRGGASSSTATRAVAHARVCKRERKTVIASIRIRHCLLLTRLAGNLFNSSISEFLFLLWHSIHGSFC